MRASRNTWRRRLPELGAAWALVLFTGGAASALDQFHFARQCPAIFGDAGTREANHRSRLKSVDSIEESPAVVTIVHHRVWRRPKPIRIEDMELVGIELREGRRYAIVELGSSAIGPDCPDGWYALQPDDSIGEEGRVLAVLESGLLLEWNGQLRFLPVEGNGAPRWQVVWRSSWTIPRYRNSAVGGATRHHQPRSASKRRR